MFSKECKKHLEEQNETGLQHMKAALWAALRLQMLVPLLIIHSIAPRFFTHKGSEVIQDILNDRKIK
tara:strand:+ start:80 stop:280 length:201 start_codon:yes stop_codon:yes gene_type:complete